MLNGARRQVFADALVLADATQPAAHLDLLVEDGAIQAVEAPGSFDRLEDAQRIDCADRLLIPGLVNGHTHAHGGLGRGAVPDRLPLEGFIASIGALNGQRGLDHVRLSAELTAVELLHRGCTATFDMAAEFPAPSVAGLLAVAEAYHALGMRAVVAPMLADRTLWQAYPGLLGALPHALAERMRALRAAPPEASLDAVKRAAAIWPFDHGRVRLGIAPTIPMHCSDEFLLACSAASAEFGLPLQTHLAESRAQGAVARQRYGRSLVAHLAHVGLLGPHVSAAHAIWIGDDDIQRLADAGATAVHNPLSNMRLGSGIAPVRRMLERGLAVGLGTDGANTSDTQNLFEAMRAAAYLSRLLDGPAPARWLDAADAFHAATAAGARVLGWAGRIGRIAPGLQADLVALRLDGMHFVPLRDALRQLVYGENAAGVDRVWVGGRLLLEGGRVLTIDEARLRRDAQAAAAHLDSLNAEALATAAQVQPWVTAFCCGLGGHA